MESLMWFSKDRFAAKRLRSIAEGLDPDRRAIIASHSAFRSMLHVSPFNVPNELIDFVAVHTDPKLREFQYRNKRIVFTKEMVRRVFDVRSGSKPVVLLTKSIQSDMRDAYKGNRNKLPITDAVKMLNSFDIKDEDAIIRTWDLLCVATVLDPGSCNMMVLEYLGSMDDPKKSHEYAWDEHFLEAAMVSVEKIQKKKKEPVVLEPGAKRAEFWIKGPMPLLAIAYMDHLDYPPNEHTFDYSLPRACFVTNKDFAFVVATDIDKLILNNKTVFGRRPFLDISKTPYAMDPVIPHVEEVEVNPSASLNEWLVFPSSQEMEVPPRFKHLYDKHKALFASDVDATLKTLATGLKSMQSQRMSSLLFDVDAAMKEDEGPSIVFATVDSPDNKTTMPTDLESQEDGTAKDVTNAGVEVGAAKGGEVNDRFEGKDAAMDDAAQKEDEMLTSTHEHVRVADVQQPAIIVDSSTKREDVGHQEDVSSPIRSDAPECVVQPQVSATPIRFVPPGYWDDCPSFELVSQDDPLFRPDNEIPTRENEASVRIDDTPSAAKGATESPKQVEAPVVSTGALDPALGTNTTAATDDRSIASTPDMQKTTDVATDEVAEKPGSTGIDTIDRKNRHKRAAKDDAATPKMKKIKVSQDASHMYDKFVLHGRNFKAGKKKAIPPPFIEIGRTHCTYKSFHGSLRPRQCLDSQVMGVWLEDFNKKQKRKYAFSCYLTIKLTVDPQDFDAKDCMNEFKKEFTKHKFLKGDLIYFAVVKNNHWITCCINMIYKQFHTFDSIRTTKNRSILEMSANNLFTNFTTLVNESKLVAIDWSEFKHITPDHPQKSTLYDCGFFSILYMQNFNARVMLDFDREAIPNFRKVIANHLVEHRENEGDLVKIMESELE